MSIVFNGKRLVKPGAYSRMDSSGMVPVSTGTAQVLAIIGTSNGGEPKSVRWFNDPQLARRYFRGGDLVKGMSLAWAPTTEANLNGADLIVGIRVNPATQAEHTLGASIKLTSRDYGTMPYRVRLQEVGGRVVISLTDGTITESSPELTSSVDAVIAWVNAYSTLCTAEKLGDVMPEMTDWTAFATTGTNPDPTNSDWQTAIDLLADEFVDGIVVLSPDADIHEMLKAHLTAQSGKRKERRGFVGGDLGESEAGTLDRAKELNNFRVVLTAPGIKSRVGGTLETLPPYFFAALVGGLWAGNNPATPLTFKGINVAGLEVSYEDVDNLLLGGVCVAERTRQGFRIVQGITTHLADQDTLYRELSCATLADRMSMELREVLEAAIVGTGNTPDTPATILNRTISTLNSFESRGWLVAGTETPAYRNVQVYKEGTAYSVEYEGSISEPNNFVLITSHFTGAR